MVLSFALPSGVTLDGKQFDQVSCAHTKAQLDRIRHYEESMGDSCVSARLADCTRFNISVLPFLACPELATLATEVLYKNNTISIE